jgi:DNA-binding MarR family transcriptional regulator
MSISKPARRRQHVAAAPPGLPPTVSRRALLSGGSDRRFRALVHDLLTIAARMELVREHLGRRIGLTGSQYSLLVAVAHLQGERGISVNAVAAALHVSSAFVASETGKLAQRRFIHKRTNPHDRRGVLLGLAPAGVQAIGRIGTEIRAINDLFFGALDSRSFASLGRAVAALVRSSDDALGHINAEEPALEAAE